MRRLLVRDGWTDGERIKTCDVSVFGERRNERDGIGTPREGRGKIMRQRAVDRKCVVINLNQCYGIANVLLHSTYYDEYNRACISSLCLSSSVILV